jgi:hypothetical protein
MSRFDKRGYTMCFRGRGSKIFYEFASLFISRLELRPSVVHSQTILRGFKKVSGTLKVSKSRSVS